MRYLSIDTETTGLDPKVCQVIEFAAVIEDTEQMDVPVEELPSFSYLVRHDSYTGEPYALHMNRDIIGMLAGVIEPDLPILSAQELCYQMRVWLMKDCGIQKPDGMIVAGKNFATFDYHFLHQLPGWIKTHRRIIDPCTLYLEPLIDSVPPSFAECLKRAGMDATVKHRALGDARDVISLLRYKWLE